MQFEYERWNSGTLEEWVRPENGSPIIPTFHYSSIPIYQLSVFKQTA
jgi:hypothetical protein